jgi:glycosyltransferase involved in cell wall biosynthesis
MTPVKPNAVERGLLVGAPMWQFKKLLPGSKREPKIFAVFANRQEDCDRLIRYLHAFRARSPSAEFPIHVYSLEEPAEWRRCEYIVVDHDARRLFQRAQQDLSDVWVALAATTWNRHPRGMLTKLIPLTLPPFRAIVLNENGDVFPIAPLPVVRHWIDRLRRQCASLAGELKHRIELWLVWPIRRLPAWFRRKARHTLLWWTAVALGRIPWFAQRVEPLIYTLFARLPEGRPARIDGETAAASQTGITRIEYRDSDWESGEIARVVKTSRARFLLFCPHAYTETFDDFMPLFDDPRTFAVTRQTGFREWRKIMFALSPFRSLAAREVSRVIAPVAGVVLVDREKLRKLPLPDTLVFGAAWLNLFWRAAAAGWRTYSIGGDFPVPQQPSRWVDEMLFVKHLYRDRTLRRLAPAESDQCRGNIAFRPDLARPYRGLPRVLIVAPYLPYPLSHGGAVRVYNLCKELADQVDFLYISFREVNGVTDYEELHKIFRRVYVVDRDENHNDPDLPESVNHFESSSMRALIGAVARDEAVDLLQIEWTDMAGYREAAPRVPAILVEHDVTYTLYRQYIAQDNRPKIRAEFERWYRFETERLRVFDGVFAMSPQDRRELVDAGAMGEKTFVIPNGVDLDRYRALPASREMVPEILYVGSFRHQPNLMGFEELRRNIMPLVWECFPNAILRVVAGPDHESHWRNALKGSAIPDQELPKPDRRIVIHGFVADLLPLYALAQVVAVPLPLSAGTNIKVMEALACRRAVVTTPVGAQGLGLENGRDVVICALGGEFAEALCRLLEDTETREAIARRGRATAEARFSWNVIAQQALEAYAEVRAGALAAVQAG